MTWREMDCRRRFCLTWSEYVVCLSSHQLYICSCYFTICRDLVWSGTTWGSKAIVKWFPPQRRGLAMGIRQTGIPIGGALASSTPFFL